MTSYRRWATRPDAAMRALRKVQRHVQETYPEPLPDESMYFNQFAARFAAMPIAAPDPSVRMNERTT